MRVGVRSFVGGIRSGALGALLFGISLARAEVCPSLFEEVELPPEIRAFLSDPRVQSRVAKYAEDPAFQNFYNEIEAWLTLEKQVGKESRSKATLRVSGGDPLFRGVLSRDKYRLGARLLVEKPGEIRIGFDINAANVTAPAAILDLETMQIALVQKLFHAFPDTAGGLKTVKIEWDLGRDAPKGFGEHLGSLGFLRTHGRSICSLTTGGTLAITSAGIGAGAGGVVAMWADVELGYGDNEKGVMPVGAVIGGVGAGAIVTSYTCRKRSSRGGNYELAFRRVVPNVEPKTE